MVENLVGGFWLVNPMV